MRCPYCSNNFRFDFTTDNMERGFTALTDNDLIKHIFIGDWCPECDKIVVIHRYGKVTPASKGDPYDFNILPGTEKEEVIYPQGTGRRPVPVEVPEDYAGDYKEACVTLPNSPKASAALSRRTLQNLLHNHLQIKGSSLEKEIEKLLETGNLPSHIAESLDALRTVGNFAAHPIKDRNTGSIVDVEPGEAEWSLEVLELLFDFYFVQPALQQRRKDELNKKLAAAGKPAMK